MARWDELLGPATFDGIEVEIVRRRIRGGRDFARKRLPYQGGQEVEDTGRLPRIIEVDIELFDSMGPDVYPGTYEALVSLLQDDVGQAEFVYEDPVWGPIDVKVSEWSDDAGAQERDGVRMRITMEEVGIIDTAEAQFSLLSVADESALDAEAEAFDELIAELASDGEIDDAWNDAGVGRKPGETVKVQDTASAFVAALNEGAQVATEVQAQVDRVKARVGALLQLPAVRDVDGWGALARGFRVQDLAQSYGEAIVSAGGKIITVDVGSPASVFEVASKLYGDRDRYEEILRGNPQLRPLYMDRGTALRVRKD